MAEYEVEKAMRSWLLLLLCLMMLPCAQASEVRMEDFMALPAPLQLALDTRIKTLPRRTEQVAALHQLLYSPAGFNITYNNQRTKTAAEAFYTRSGNCLSLAALYVASARYLGMDARFQAVEIPFQWLQRDNTMYYLGHVNALVKLGHNRVTAEFLGAFTAEESAKFKSVEMSDAEALARYYNNLGVEAMVRQEPSKAFDYLQAAIEKNKKYADAWVNLGVWYKSQQRGLDAEQAYLTAVHLESKNTSALSNLMVLYQAQGRTQMAAQVAAKLHKHRLRNPYYLANLAERALQEKDYATAVSLLKKAVKKQEEGHFYQLLGQAYFGLGEKSKSQIALEKSVALAANPQDKSLRSGKLAALRSMSAGH
ncbi:MAG TPA: transglutaminase domain-containing protein [Cellvibrionaceae bacterium]|nr:transglutaminase domain-containing protein [Cellvibrionaceae bacterium]HMW70784.1 transglutaminase domain-containing protein [Cellvibrionaceae bacterium]HNG60156.1 transglutaminase domain-containing protein [Cellvibrionaceae bacterium]